MDPPLGPGLTEAQWHTLPDARALLRHAIPRIPVRHTALVLSYLAELLFEDWHRERPEDWQVAGCLAVLRAWCFGEASLEEVNALRAEVKRASVEERAPASREESWRCAQRAALATLSASLFAGYARNHDADVGSALVIVDSILSTAREQDPQVRAAKSAVDWARAEAQALTRLNGAINNRVLRSAHVAVEQRVLASVANQLRVWIPYPGRRAQTWERKSETLVCAGDALLTVHGWRILDAHPLPTVPRYPRGGWI